jgi:hypothetical protein
MMQASWYLTLEIIYMDPLLLNLLEELKTEVKSLRQDMTSLVIQMSKYKGFIAGVLSVFTAIGSGIVAAAHFFWGGKA